MKIKSGSVLIAEPFLDDAHFRRSVILLTEHNNKGTLGFVLNRVMGTKACEVLPSFPAFDAKLYYGGPVETDSVHFLHTKGELIEGSYKVMPGVWWGGNFEQLKMLIETKLITSNQVRFYLGYSGWDPNQLNEEVDDKVWFLHKCRKDYIFNPASGEEMWKQILTEMGGDYKHMAEFPENPQYN